MRRFEGAIPVSWHINHDRSDRVGQHSFRACSVAGVALISPLNSMQVASRGARLLSSQKRCQSPSWSGLVRSHHGKSTTLRSLGPGQRFHEQRRVPQPMVELDPSAASSYCSVVSLATSVSVIFMTVSREKTHQRVEPVTPLKRQSQQIQLHPDVVKPGGQFW